MKRKSHRVAAIIATLCITTFFSMTVITELTGDKQTITLVKSLIVMPGLFILIPAIAITGLSGFSLAKKRKGLLVNRKQKRMPFIAVNGLLVLLPCALYLNHAASNDQFDNMFYLIQSLELLAGLINLSLMGLNIRDGLKMTGKLTNSNAAAKDT